MTADRPADLVLARRPRRHRWTRRGAGPSAVAVRDGRIVAVGDDADDPAARSGPRTPGRSSSRGRTVRPGFQDAHVHPIARRAGPAPLRPARAARPRRLPRRSIAAYAAAPPRRALDPRQRLVHGRLPGRRRRAARTSTGSSRIGRSSSRTATATAAWVNSRGPRARRDHRRDRRPGRRPDRARRRRRRRSATLHEGADGPRRAAPPADHRRTSWWRRSGSARRELHSLGITTWQDAIVDARTLEELAYVGAGRPRRADRAGRRGALVGAVARRRADRRARRAARADGRRPLPGRPA